MNFFGNRRGFSLLELLIALSILIIMTGAATLYLGDILFKSKVAKAKNDMETFVTAVTLSDAENPTNLLDSGLFGASPQSNILGVSLSERDDLGTLVGTYLLALPNDPWGGSYKINSYAGYVKTFAADYAISGTSKYDKDILSYYLPENLFLAKVRADDLNGNGTLDTGDEILLYFSKSVRCNVVTGTGDAIAYDGSTDNNANLTPYGIAVVDVHTNRDSERSIVDGYGYDDGAGGVVPDANSGLASWTAHDLRTFKPGDYDAAISSRILLETYSLNLGEAGGEEGSDNLAARADYGFHRPADVVYYASFFSRKLKFWMPRTNESRGSDESNVDVGYELYIPARADEGVDFHEAYAIWESSQGYSAYKTTAEKNKLYLQQTSVASARRTLIFKSIVD